MYKISKFIYDLAGHPQPTENELDEEIDRLLLVISAETPTYLVQESEQDPMNQIDSEIISFWIKRRFEPTLLLMLLSSEDNYPRAKGELKKMERYGSVLDKFFRPYFVEKRAMQRVRELCFDNNDNLDLQKSLLRLRKTLTFLSRHLEEDSPESRTLFNADAYTTADVALYRYLKRIIVGNYENFGLKSHVQLCRPLIDFMSRFATKNPHVQDVSAGDPFASDNEASLVTDMTKPAIIALGFVLFYLWRRG